jgi:Na+/proline symporter
MPMSQTTALVMVILFGIAMFLTTIVRRNTKSIEVFLAADRSVGVITGALSVASTWIWAPSLFVAAQKAYQEGLPGLMWFTVPNVGCLILFAFVAPRIRNVFPKGYTLPEYIASRFDAKTHIVYLFCFLSLQICSMAVQLIAGAALLTTISGLPHQIGVLALAAMFTAYSLIDGLDSSIRTDFSQMIIMGIGLAVIVPMAVVSGGGIPTLAAGLSGATGEYGNLFNPKVAYSFGITVTIALMSGPFGDQQHWGRVFAFAEGKVCKGYILGAIIFAFVPLTMGLLGFLAAGNPHAAPSVRAGIFSAQQVGPDVVCTLLPSWGLLLFVLVILCGLASTGDSALCAGGTLIAIDIYRKYIRPDVSDKTLLTVSRLSVLFISLAAIGIALIPGITILNLFLFYGTLRSSTLMPTILIVLKDNLSSSGIFGGMALSILFGLPVYLIGEIIGNTDMKVAANIGIVLISLILPMVFTKNRCAVK